MDDITTKYGKDKADEHWRRILAGFFLNNVSPMKADLENHSTKAKSGLIILLI